MQLEPEPEQVVERLAGGERAAALGTACCRVCIVFDRTACCPTVGRTQGGRTVASREAAPALRGADHWKVPLDNTIYDAAGDIWWDPDQPLSAIRTMLNPGRVAYLEGVLETTGLLPEVSRALDVGCGGGLMAEEVARIGFSVAGADPSGQSLRTARGHAADGELGINYVRARGEQLPFGDGVFDLVYCVDVLEHVDDLDQVLTESARVLRPGGVYLYDTINRTLLSHVVAIGLLQEWRLTRILPPRLHDWGRFIRPQELAAIMGRHGLRVSGRAGLVPTARPLRLLRAFVRLRRGEVGYAEFGRLCHAHLSRFTAGLHIGYAVKEPGASGPGNRDGSLETRHR